MLAQVNQTSGVKWAQFPRKEAAAQAKQREKAAAATQTFNVRLAQTTLNKLSVPKLALEAVVRNGAWQHVPQMLRSPAEASLAAISSAEEAARRALSDNGVGSLLVRDTKARRLSHVDPMPNPLQASASVGLILSTCEFRWYHYARTWF